MAVARIVSKIYFVYVCVCVCVFVFMDAFFAPPSGSPFVAASAFILYLCLLVLFALHILLQLCLKVIRKEKKHGISEVEW